MRTSEGPEAVTAPISDGAPIEDQDPLVGVRKLEKEEILGLQLAEALHRAARAEMELATMKQHALLARIDPQDALKTLNNEIRRAMAAMTEAKRQHLAIRSAVESRLKISLDKVSYDDETGVVHESP